MLVHVHVGDCSRNGKNRVAGVFAGPEVVGAPLNVEDRLTETESAVGYQPGGIIHEGDQIRLTKRAVHGNAEGSMHGVAIPDSTHRFGHETVLFFGLAGRSSHLRQALLLQQAMNGGMGDAPLRHQTGGFQQLPDLADRTTGIIPLGLQDGFLNGGGQLGAPAVVALLREQNNIFSCYRLAGNAYHEHPSRTCR